MGKDVVTSRPNICCVVLAANRCNGCLSGIHSRVVKSMGCGGNA